MHIATKLRKEGKSLKEISEITGLSMHTVSKHARKAENHLSLKSKFLGRPNNNNHILGTNANKQQWDNAKSAIARQAQEEFIKISGNSDTMLFLGLYWGEGRKKGSISIANNDPYLLKTCYNTLLTMTNNKFALYLKLYPDHDKDTCNKFWSELLPNTTIHIGQIHDKRKKKKPGKSKFGLATLSVNDWRLATKISTWLDMLRSGAT